jgi:hypothetical protein
MMPLEGAIPAPSLYHLPDLEFAVLLDSLERVRRIRPTIVVRPSPKDRVDLPHHVGEGNRSMVIDDGADLRTDTFLRLSARSNPQPDPATPPAMQLTNLKSKEVRSCILEIHDVGLVPIQNEIHAAELSLHYVDHGLGRLAGYDEQVVTIPNELRIPSSQLLRHPFHPPVTVEHVKKDIRKQR